MKQSLTHTRKGEMEPLNKTVVMIILALVGIIILLLIVKGKVFSILK